MQLYFTYWPLTLGLALVVCSSGLVDSACVPIEQWIDVVDVTNEGFTTTSHNYRTTVGTQKSQSSTSGSQSSSTQTRDSESSSGSSSNRESSSGSNAGINLGFGGFGASGGVSKSSSSGSSMQQSFSQRIGSSSTSGYNWESTDSTMFNSETTEDHTFTCEARTRCVVTQLVGKFCNVQVKVRKFAVKRLPISTPSIGQTQASATRIVDVTISKPGETWIVAKNLTFANHSGIWEPAQICDSASFVNGFQFKSSNWTGLTGFSLTCSTRNETSPFKMVKEIQSGAGFAGSWYSPFRSQSKEDYAIGFVFQTWKGRGGSRFKGNWKLLFKGQKSHLFLPKGSYAVQRSEVKCPERYAVCGIQTMLGAGSIKSVTAVGFKCCYYCIPQERHVTVDSFQNDGDFATTHTVTKTVGTRKETGTSLGGQNGTDSSINSEGTNLQGVQAGFAAQFGNSRSEGFNWGSTSASMWNSETTKSFTWMCSPKRKCAVKQLVGYCGIFEILTPHTIIESVE